MSLLIWSCLNLQSCHLFSILLSVLQSPFHLFLPAFKLIKYFHVSILFLFWNYYKLCFVIFMDALGFNTYLTYSTRPLQY